MNNNNNNNITYKCIKSECPKYFQSDIYETCLLADDYCIDKCIGIDLIDSEIENINFKKGRLNVTSDRLTTFKNLIINNQNENINKENNKENENINNIEDLNKVYKLAEKLHSDSLDVIRDYENGFTTSEFANGVIINIDIVLDDLEDGWGVNLEQYKTNVIL